jgi:hypothetical protein
MAAGKEEQGGEKKGAVAEGRVQTRRLLAKANQRTKTRAGSRDLNKVGRKEEDERSARRSKRVGRKGTAD